MSRQENRHANKTPSGYVRRRWLIGLIAASTSVVLMAALAFYLYNARYTEENQERLRAQAAAIAAETEVLLKERQDNATILGVSSSVAYVISGHNLSDEEHLGEDWLLSRLQAEQEYRVFDTVAVLDVDGRVIEYAGEPVPSSEWFRSVVTANIGISEGHAVEVSDPAGELSYWWLATLEHDGSPVGMYAQSVDLAPFVQRILSHRRLPDQTDIVSVVVPQDGGWHLFFADGAEFFESGEDLSAAEQRLGLPDGGFDALADVAAGAVGLRTAAAPVQGSDWVAVAYVPDDVARTHTIQVAAITFGAALVSLGFVFSISWFWRRDTLLAESEHRAMVLAEEALEAQDHFMANMSHEFRTPLNAVIGFSQIVLSGLAGDINSEQRRQLEMVEQGGKRLLVLVDDVLDLANVKAGAAQVCPREFTVRELIDGLHSLMCPLAKERGLECSAAVPDDEVVLRTDRDMVERILGNLLSNAIKFTKDGFVRLAVKRVEGDRVSFAVHDSGCGIPAESIDEVMQEFLQVVEPQGVKPVGTGLGLALSKRMAQMLGGDIEVSSKRGVGSTFTLTIPREYHGDADKRHA
ncbi:MAG: HAMP domain-containing sensor histidine kinase [Coriobacteriia bacterium]|nr:HAMP domain-containing sensor histidine kinase [Coriobacteriia bacterium]